MDSPFGHASFISRVTFAWASPLVAFAARGGRRLELSDLWALRREEGAERCADVLGAAWQAEIASAAAMQRTPSFARALWAVIRWRLLLVGLWKMGWLLFCVLSNSLLLRETIAWFGSGRPTWWGAALAAAYLACELARSVCVNQHWLEAVLLGMQVRAGARRLIADKLLRVRGGGGGGGKQPGGGGGSNGGSGAVVNVLVGDTQRLLDGVQYCMFLLSAPISLAVCLAISIVVLGPGAAVGFAVLVLLTPLQAYLGNRVGKLRAHVVKHTDARARQLTELLSAFRIVKLYGWEAAMADSVAATRNAEISALRRSAIMRAANSLLSFSLPLLVTTATFGSFVLVNRATGNPLTASSAFVLLALFNVARFPINVLPLAVKNVAEAKAACTRLGGVLMMDERQEVDLPLTLPATDALPASERALSRWRELLGDSAAALPPPSIAVRLSQATYTHAPGLTSGIDGVSLDVPTGSVVAIVGPVASGKSSLLSALAGEMTHVSGGAAVRASTIAYTSQLPWVFAATVRDNIVFGLPYDAAAYARVVDVCDLEPDIASWPARDDSELGQNGINVSGGQRARLALARALYSRAPLLLLDDPLSALDVTVARRVWHRAILAAAARGTTVLIATHQEQFVASATLVVEMAAGRTAFIGSPDEWLRTRRGGSAVAAEHAAAVAIDDVTVGVGAVAADLVDEDGPSPLTGALGGLESGSSGPAATTATPSAATPTPPLETSIGTDPAAASVVGAAATPPPATAAADPAGLAAKPFPSIAQSPDGLPSKPTVVPPVGRLTVAEDRAEGAVAGSSVAAYLRSGGGLAIGAAIAVALVASKGARQVSDWYLAVWTSAATTSPSPIAAGYTQAQHLGIYTAIVTAVILATLVQGLLFAMVLVRASRRFHDRVFVALLRAPISWMETQPTGRLLARLTADVDIVDNALPANLEPCGELLVQTWLSVLLVAILLPPFFAGVVVIVALFVYIVRYFRAAARDLKRLDSIARSPMVTHIASAAVGLAYVRLWPGAAARFLATATTTIDDTTRTYWATYAANRWVAARLDVITSVIAAVTSGLCIAAGGSISPALAGLAITQALQTAGIFQYSVRLLTDTETLFVSVERLEHFATHVAPEPDVLESPPPPLASAVATPGVSSLAAAALAAVPPPAAAAAALAVVPHQGGRSSAGSHSSCLYDGWLPAAWDATLVAHGWPWCGQVVFRNVTVRYRANLPPVLRNLSLTVPGGCRLGIVGRTGSGKSTLLSALFRLLAVEAGGSITVDGVPVSQVNVFHLRSRLAIITQEPTLFAGTLRHNIDVFSRHDDAAIHAAIDSAGLTAWVASHPNGLDRIISDGASEAAGGSLSVGERQLVALLRALLRGARVIALDEATSATDNATDALVQAAVRHAFRHATILIIAHRLHTVLDCDLVAVMRDGAVLECGAPARLLADAAGALTAMVDATGPATAAALRTLAMRADSGTVAAPVAPSPAVVA